MDDNFSGDELSEKERQAIRRIIRDDDRARFLWRTVRIWGGYLAAFGAALYATWEGLLKHVRFGP